MKPLRGYEALRRHRWSQQGFSYFVTLCTDHRQVGLDCDKVAPVIRDELEACASDGYWRLRGAVIMPEHLHLLAELTGDLPLGRIIARVKAKSRAVMSARGLRWQGNFYEHQLRAEDGVESVLYYLFLNPYRAGIITADKQYSWFLLSPIEAEWFKPLLDDGRPFPEWLR